MVVDDDPDTLKVLTKMLERQGHNVHAFDKPESALAHVKAGCKDCTVVLSDIRMPGMSGYELTRAVKSLSAETKVFLMSAYDFDISQFDKVFPRTMVDGFIQKPITTGKLAKSFSRATSP